MPLLGRPNICCGKRRELMGASGIGGRSSIFILSMFLISDFLSIHRTIHNPDQISPRGVGDRFCGLDRLQGRGVELSVTSSASFAASRKSCIRSGEWRPLSRGAPFIIAAPGGGSADRATDQFPEAEARYLPPYSPDMNRIEKAFPTGVPLYQALPLRLRLDATRSESALAGDDHLDTTGLEGPCVVVADAVIGDEGVNDVERSQAGER